MAITNLKTDMRERSERSGREERGMDKDGDDRGRKGGGSFHKKKVCRFCSDQEFILDYKDVRMMQSFVTEHGKIVPRRISGNCALHQRQLTTAVKRARNLALVGYVSMGT
ncbi:MAG: 30S ribosomal protein S18 [Bdellovibrionia bacterium]